MGAATRRSYLGGYIGYMGGCTALKNYIIHLLMQIIRSLVAKIYSLQAGHDFPIVFYLALGGSLLSYIYSAPPLKVVLLKIS
jgi:hypothetical protein